ncbi:flagellar hook basal-body protein [Alphaproteobacteria bacterium]|nr:flagellar hook basal-body protein [Alphaproteobacteria bacterium]
MLSILKSALNANSQEMGIVSNNIANANSTGFKKSTANFEHFYSIHNSSDPDKFSGMGVLLNDPRQQMSQGAFQATGGALDLAVTGQGFFTLVQGNQVETPFFTRDGSFNIKANGEVVTNDGLSVMGYLGEDKQGAFQNLIIPTQKVNLDNTTSIISNINVNSRGKITATYGLDNEVIIGHVGLASFTNDPGLSPVGNNRYQYNTKSGAPEFGIAMDGAFGKLEAGYLERSNVDITSEMVSMLKTQQAFSGVSRLLQTEVDITKRLIDG